MSLCVYSYTGHHHNIQSNKNMFITSKNSLVSACVLSKSFRACVSNIEGCLKQRLSHSQMKGIYLLVEAHHCLLPCKSYSN